MCYSHFEVWQVNSQNIARGGLCVCVRMRAGVRVCVFLIYLLHAPLQSVILHA